MTDSFAAVGADNGPRPYVLISFIGVGDAPLIRAFIEHHRLIGVTQFRLILHGRWAPMALRYLDDQPDVVIVEMVRDPYSEALLRQKYNQLIQQLAGQWVVLVDGDEFLEIPYSNLDEMVDCMHGLGIRDLPALMVQRLTEDGELRALGAEEDIKQKFPMMNFSLCEDLNSENPTWKEKFPFFFATSSTRSMRGNHLPPNGVSPTSAPVRAVLHHFKWTASFREYMTIWKPGTGRGNDEEHAAYKAWLEANDYRLPTGSSVAYSRATLFQQGLLIRPSRREFEVASTLKAVIEARDGVPQVDLAERLDALALPATNAEPSIREYTAPRNLLLPPGRICFVSFELPGPSKTGGIGTAIGALAESLAQMGHTVEVVFCPFRGEPRLAQLWWDYWSRRGVSVHYFPRSMFGGWYTEHSRFDQRLNEYLANLEFDLIHFVDAGGYLGRFARLLRSRDADPRIRTLLTVHGPGDWHRRGNLIPWQMDEPFERASFSYSLELADFVAFPSNYMKKWTMERYRLTAPHGVVPNALSGFGRSFTEREPQTRAISEVVFFGRVEPRKGFGVFCEAIDELVHTVNAMPKITVMGRLGETLSGDWLSDAFGRHRDHIKYIGNYGNIDAINYLKTRDCVAVVPSKRDNLPYTVYECVENGIPIMTSDVGGISELIDAHDRERVLVAGDSATLAAALRSALSEGFAPARPAFEASIANVAQLALHARLVADARVEVPRAAARQRHAAFAVPQIRYGEPPSRQHPVQGPSPANSARETMAASGWSTWANKQVQDVESDFVFLRDKDVRLLDADAVESMSALQSAGDYDAVVSDCQVSFRGRNGAQVRLGGLGRLQFAPARPAEMSPMKNIYGAGWLLIKRRVFLEAGGFRESLRDSRYAHWELLNRLQAGGYRIASVPRALVSWEFENASAWNKELEHELVEHLLRPWLRGADFDQENIFRYAVGNLIVRERPWASIYRGFLERQAEKLGRWGLWLRNRLRA